ncbi:MAG: hypothetical protein NXY57DRAFT_1030071 [Lentinula lateritia]|uniref:Uncharacterized protein n=1 Tax=Lentinula lateritia TaxID=40482 RepID=A0ABQ8VM57_9AGAR|nr:MAG: hypothetical protein NXY57DRAFT_1030071 [Lentinula lateritia]KAJ4494252.1 hypothetical protein C8R41DRAFT_829485 [Lentinula lateritia]
MASLTISPRPFVSSPLAGASQHTGVTTRPSAPRRNPSFPSSRALRPFPSVANALRPYSTASKKAVKLIEPPKNQPCVFMLNLTQAEFGRQD